MVDVEELLITLHDESIPEEEKTHAIDILSDLAMDFSLLQGIGDDTLIRLLDSSDSYIRITAVGILGLIGTKTAVEPLISMLNVEKHFDQCAVLDALYSIGDRRAIGPILELAKQDIEPVVMNTVLTALEILDFKGVVLVIDREQVTPERYNLDIESI
jgi:hypothetical protein